MRRTTVQRLKACARSFLKGVHPTGAPNVDFITFGMATGYLRNQFGHKWANEMLFGQHATVSRPNRDGRAFMRAEAACLEDTFRNMQRATRVAELLFNMQNIVGIDERVEELRIGHVESTVSELEAGAFLIKRGAAFRYVTPSGKKGTDYDGEITLPDNTIFYCEMKCKIEATKIGKQTVLTSLSAAREQLPAQKPGLVFLKIPETWVLDPEAPAVMAKALSEFLRNTSRVVAVVVQWEVQQIQGPGTRFFYQFRLERGSPPKSVSSATEALLNSLEVPAGGSWVSFRKIAEEVLRK